MTVKNTAQMGAYVGWIFSVFGASENASRDQKSHLGRWLVEHALKCLMQTGQVCHRLPFSLSLL
jgi:hypothetical protein